MPRDCFVNMYEKNRVSALALHRDHVSFCTVVLCLLIDDAAHTENLVGGNLVIVDEIGVEQIMQLNSHEILVFARIDHYVQKETRKSNLITINSIF